MEKNNTREEKRMEKIITAAITGIITLLVCLMNNHYQQRKADQEQDERAAKTAHEHEKSLIEVKNASEQAIMTMNAQLQQSIALLDCKFDELTKKVEKHNCLVERTYKLESESELMIEKLKVANHRIDDLENRIG